MKLTDTGTATLRTGWQVAVLTAIASAVTHLFDVDIEVEDLLWLAPAVGVAGGIVYRASRWLGDRWPTLGHILFGINKAPAYVDTTGR